MGICSFLGHNCIYDVGLYHSILKVVKQIVKQDTETEFVFDRQTQFHSLCLCAVLEARQRYSEKRVKITFISRNDMDEQERLYPGINRFPFCVFDKIIQLPELTCPVSKAHFEWRRERRALVDHSDYLVCYEYPDLLDDSIEIYDYALRSSTLTIFNVVNDKTSQYIKDSIVKLDTKQQYIIHAKKNGKGYSTIGAEFGVSREAIRGQDKKGRRKLRRYAEERYKQLSADCKCASPICAVILPAKIDEGDEQRLGQVVAFLTQYMGVNKFLVEHMNCHSQFVDYLLRIKYIGRFRVELVTHYPDSIATTWGSTAEGFVPPFDGVDNIDTEGKTLKSRYHRALSSMLERCEFAICKGETYSDLTALRIIRRNRKLKVFDLGISQEHCSPK